MAKRKVAEGRSNGPKPSAATGAAKIPQRSRNAAPRESSAKVTSISKVPTAGARSHNAFPTGYSQPKAKRPRRSAAAGTSVILATSAGTPSSAPTAEVPAAAPPAQVNTAAVVAEVIKQLQQGGFLVKPVTTAADADEVVPAADAGRVAMNIGGDDIVETTLTSLLHGEPQPLQAPEGPKFISASIPLASQVPKKIKQKIWSDEFVEMAELISDQSDQKLSVTFSQLDDNSPALAMTSHSKPKPILTFSQWQSAFNIFVAIYAERRASETPELMKYAETIREIASKFPGRAWFFYDQQFRYARQGTQISWADMHMELYLKCISMHGVGQPAAFQGHNSTAGNRKFQPSRYANQGPQNAFQVKVTFCYKFNGGKLCDAAACKHKHACIACAGPHPRVACPARAWTRPGKNSATQPGQSRRALPVPAGVPRT